MNAQIPLEVEKTLHKLEGAGYQALLVGGCVRDLVMGASPKDWDLATSATPVEIMATLGGGELVGSSQAYPVVYYRGAQIATYRKDGINRKDAEGIKVGATLEEDAQRRDLTINALYMTLSGEVLDPTGMGLDDIGARVIRMVGNPANRIEEDPIRVMRAVKFLARLGHTANWKIEAATRAAINAYPLDVPPERYRDELIPMLLHPSRSHALTALTNLGLLAGYLEELAPLITCEHENPYHQEGSVWNHTIMVIRELPEVVTVELVMAALLHDIGKPSTKNGSKYHGHAEVGAEMAEKVCKRLRLSNTQTRGIVWLIKHHMIAHNLDLVRLSKRVAMVRESGDLMVDLVELQKADHYGRSPRPEPGTTVEVEEAAREAIMVAARKSLKAIGIDGLLVMERTGLPPGKELGAIMKNLQELMDDNPDATADELLSLACPI